MLWGPAPVLVETDLWVAAWGGGGGGRRRPEAAVSAGRRRGRPVVGGEPLGCQWCWRRLGLAVRVQRVLQPRRPARDSYRTGMAMTQTQVSTQVEGDEREGDE